MSNEEQESIAKALEQYTIAQTEKDIAGYRPGFTTVWDAAKMVDLEVAYSLVLLPNRIYPSRASKLGNGKYAVYNVGYPRANMGDHWWNVEPEELKIQRARFLLQRDVFFQDLAMKRREPERFLWFRTYTGAAIVSPPNYVVEQKIAPLFFPEGILINKLMSDHIAKFYVFLDGTIGTASF